MLSQNIANVNTVAFRRDEYAEQLYVNQQWNIIEKNNAHDVAEKLSKDNDLSNAATERRNTFWQWVELSDIHSNFTTRYPDDKRTAAQNEMFGKIEKLEEEKKQLMNNASAALNKLFDQKLDDAKIKDSELRSALHITYWRDNFDRPSRDTIANDAKSLSKEDGLRNQLNKLSSKLLLDGYAPTTFEQRNNSELMLKFNDVRFAAAAGDFKGAEKSLVESIKAFDKEFPELKGGARDMKMELLTALHNLSEFNKTPIAPSQGAGVQAPATPSVAKPSAGKVTP